MVTMLYPLVGRTGTKFEAGDEPINSAVLAEIFAAMGVRYDAANDAFIGRGNKPFAVRIDDYHDTDDAPHYQLNVGFKSNLIYNGCEYYLGVVRYIDYESTGDGVRTKPGRYYILVYGRGSGWTARRIARKANAAYKEAMRKAYPHLHVMTSKMMTEERGWSSPIEEPGG